MTLYSHMMWSSLSGHYGSAAGGQLAGRQHNAEDGPTLLLCTLAALQWQVWSLVLYQFNIIV